MNRNVWKQPLALVQKFEPNEYVAGCGDVDITYWFECNAGSSISGMNTVYEETNGVDGLQTGRGGDKRRSSTYYACNERHKVREGETFLNGYVVVDRGWFGAETLPVLIWTEGGTNTHCTTELDMSKWEETKS